MKLPAEDADLFFKLMWSLQNYVNLKMAILPDVSDTDEYRSLPPNETLGVRNALYDNIHLIDSYVEENPEDLPLEELEIVKGWKKFRRGDFFIERVLKKHAIFIGDNQVYAVLGLYESLKDLLPYVRLPYYATAVLLPFKGKIVYDGMLEGYPISIGGGIKSHLRETYMAAKQNGRIIESFDVQKQSAESTAKRTPTKDWGPVLEEIWRQVKKLRSSRGAPAICSPAFSVAKAGIELAKLSVEMPDDIDGLWLALKKVRRAMSKAETVLHRAEYY